MRIAIVGLLVALAGCASTQEREVLDPSSDAWTPPGQGDLTVADSQEPVKARPKPRARALQQPNHRETDSRVAVRR